MVDYRQTGLEQKTMERSYSTRKQEAAQRMIEYIFKGHTNVVKWAPKFVQIWDKLKLL